MRNSTPFKTNTKVGRAVKYLLLTCALSSILVPMLVQPVLSRASEEVTAADLQTEADPISASNPTLFKDLWSGVDSSAPWQFRTANDLMFFAASDANGDETLWKSDGTVAGTLPSADFYSEDLINPELMTELGGSLILGTDYDGFYRIYKSDGSLAGTVEIHDLSLSYPLNSSSLAGYILFDGSLYFFMRDVGLKLWVTDGTNLGTAAVTDIPSSGDPAENLVVFGEAFYFNVNRTLWKSDGTPGGTVVVKEFSTGTIEDMLVFDGRLFISADDGDPAGWELWISDGTPGGTQLFKDINPGSPDSHPEVLAVAGSKLYFSANVVGTYGDELWVTDGTPEGTQMVKDIDTGPGSTSPSLVSVIGSKIYFAVNEDDFTMNLWVSDGTEVGTSEVKHFNADYLWEFATLETGGRFYFGACLPDTGCELWSSDGTEPGTGIVSDINPNSGDSWPYFGIEYGEKWFFAADDGEHGDELWKMDLVSGDHFIYLPVILNPAQ